MKKVLFVLFEEFGKILDGGDQCNKRNLNVLQSLCGENNVDIIYLRKNGRTTIKELFAFVLYHRKGYYRAVTPNVVDNICNIAKNYDCVFLSSSLFGKIAEGLRLSGYNGKIIIQFHNVETIYYETVLSKHLPLRRSLIRCISENEKLACSMADVRIALNSRDAKELNKISNNKVDYIIPITLADKCKENHPDKQIMTNIKPLVVFIGSNFPPNANGVLWFVEKVFPYVDINLVIVGKDMDLLKEKNSVLQKIDVRSNVPDLSEYFENADVIISPIFSGSGMKVKTCESLMYGKNILGSTEAFEGYDVDPMRVGCVANTPEEYIAYINKICRNPIPRFNEYSRRIYLEKYSNDSVEIIFKEILS